jgi:PBP1b-binding outer membrane lipoprotein LpoB
MKIKILYLIVIATLLLSACSTGSAATNPSVDYLTKGKNFTGRRHAPARSHRSLCWKK